MKYSLGVLFALSLLLLGCKNKDEVDFCNMLALDQSFFNMDTTDMNKLNADRNRRKEIILNNFKELIDYSSRNGFPEMGKLNVSGLDSCRNWAVFMTCFHIGQIAPQLFFEKKTVTILTREIHNGNLKSRSLFSSLREGFGVHEFCESKKDLIHQTLDTWEIQVDELPNLRFKKCSS